MKVCLIIVASVLVSCSGRESHQSFDGLLGELAPHYESYFAGSIEERYDSMVRVIDAYESASPMTWNGVRKEYVLALGYARLSIASKDFGKDSEAEKFRLIAIENWRRAILDYDHQQEHSIAPGSTGEASDEDLFKFVNALDESARKGLKDDSNQALDSIGTICAGPDHLS